ncbi:glycoside hydrolase family 31 protein [Prevotella sp. E13-17]|uniref:glycoside hydrolase family 31 protein n=1 Tax=Prevotella sp. E13-17 TaxID=2913616 RepID=UPI001EDC13C4|nr:TIM-barrel domain-containing protein [Prevotella sp. E13-17]UKK51111.1 glycoside hydrolase family 31 protein [Prevotella sp. E13-17]
MRKIFTAILLLVGLLPAMAADSMNPLANADAIVNAGEARFTVLTPELIRIQYSRKQQFEDRATFAVVNRRLPVPRYTKEVRDGYLYITTDALTLRYKMGGRIDNRPNDQVLTIQFKLNGRQVTWYPGKDDKLNLKGTTRTLDGQIGDNKRQEMENGLLSRAGWSIIDESPRTRRGDGSTTFAFDKSQDGIEWVAQPVDKEAIDWYFLGYGHQYKKALGDYIKIAGRQPMPPLYVLGYWYSKYQRYTSEEFMEIVNDVKKNQIPMDVMIFDMDWHTEGWTGWTWDRTAIPDPEGLIKFMHDNGLKVSLNLHPADGVDSDEDMFEQLRDSMGMDAATKVVPWNLSDPKFYHHMFNSIIRARENQGVDFWWLDWQQNLTSKYVDGLSETFWCNHVFYNDMRLNRPNHRPLIFHRWGGLGSHRYPIGFSGDSFTTYGTLAWQPYFTATASNVGFGYWGHDLGGHQQTGANDPEIYLRWMQYGVFTPIFRTHATNWEGIERRIWKYENFPLLLETVKLRYALMPYIYTAARQAYDTGVSMCRPLYYDSPEANNAYLFEDEYMFGDDILVAPVVTPSGKNGKAERRTWLPEGKWFDVCRNKVVEGNRVFVDSYSQPEIPYFYRAGAVIVNNPPMMNLNTRPDRLIVKVVPGADGESALYEDEGDTEGYKESAYSWVKMSHKDNSLTIHPRKGSFPGMPAKRAYTVEFLSTDCPTAVTVNGKKQDNGTWNYDENRRVVTVFVPATACDKKINVNLEK